MFYEHCIILFSIVCFRTSVDLSDVEINSGTHFGCLSVSFFFIVIVKLIVCVGDTLCIVRKASCGNNAQFDYLLLLIVTEVGWM